MWGDFQLQPSCVPPPQSRRQQQELLKLQQQQALQQAQQPQAKPSGWGGVAKQPAVTKSLLEIQREEAQQMKQRKEQQPPHAAATPPRSVGAPNQPQPRRCDLTLTLTRSFQTPLSTSVWGSVNTSISTNWGSDSSSVWGDPPNANIGFWDDAVKEAVLPPPQPRKGSTQKNSKGNANLRYFSASQTIQQQ